VATVTIASHLTSDSTKTEGDHSITAFLPFLSNSYNLHHFSSSEGEKVKGVEVFQASIVFFNLIQVNVMKFL
jgi:hypothetical protein